MAAHEKCIYPERFIEIEGKLKGNNELTLLKMNQIEKDIKEINDKLDLFIESANATYLKKDTVIIVLYTIGALSTVVGIVFGILQTIQPILNK